MKNKKLLREIERWVYEDIAHLDEDDFEKLHFYDVTRYIKSLAKQRGLNAELAQMIGMMHDIGRTKLSKSGRAHNISGEMLTSYYLENKGLDHEMVELISKAVLNHSNKGVIDDPYSELIKDADSMAHLTEFGALDLNLNEQVRCDVAFLEGPLIKAKKYRKIGKIIDDLLINLDMGLKKKSLLKGDIDQVIKISDDIYGIRSMIWLIKQSDKVAYQQLKPLELSLKQAARVFEIIRSYKAFVDLVDHCNNKKRTSILLQQGIVYHQEMISNQVKYFIDCESIEASIGRFKHLMVRPLKPERLTIKYKQLHMSKDNEGQSDLKKLYLYGKQLYILNNYKIIKLAKPFKKNLNELDILLGANEKRDGLKRLMTKNKQFNRYVSGKERKEILSFLTKTYHQNEIKSKQAYFVSDLLLRDKHVSL